MNEFIQKLEYLKHTSLCEFKLYNRSENKLKIYYIYADNLNYYVNVDLTPNSKNGKYYCEFGDLFCDLYGKKIFEDTPTETYLITKHFFNQFKKYQNTLSDWTNLTIDDIRNIWDRPIITI